MGWAWGLNPLEKDVDLSRYILCHGTEYSTAKTTLTKRLSEHEGERITWKDSCVLLGTGIIYIVYIVSESDVHKICKYGYASRGIVLTALEQTQSGETLYRNAIIYCIIALKPLPQSVGT